MGPAATTPEPVYSTLAGDPDFRELLELFQQSVPEKCQALRTAVEAGDLPSAQVEAHRLKGAGAAYGFADLSALASELEQACRRQDLLAVTESLRRVTEHLERIRV